MQLSKLEEALARVLPTTTEVLAQFDSELRRIDQTEKAERDDEKRMAKSKESHVQNEDERRLAQREKRERRRKLVDVVAKLRTIHQSVVNIHAALRASNVLREPSVIIVASAINGRIIGELCSELFLLQDGFLGAASQVIPSGPPTVPVGAGHRGAIPTSAEAPLPIADNLWGRMMQLRASGKIEKTIFHHFQTLRLVGNKAAHSSVLKATMVRANDILPPSPVLTADPGFSLRWTWLRSCSPFVGSY